MGTLDYTYIDKNAHNEFEAEILRERQSLQLKLKTRANLSLP